MIIWLCERGHITPGSDGAPVCWTCDSLNVHQVEIVPTEDAPLFALREERDAAKRAHLACQEAWEQQRAELAESQRMAAQLHEIRVELLAELECEKLDSHGLMERVKELEAWKREARLVMDPVLDAGQRLSGVRLGESVAAALIAKAQRCEHVEAKVEALEAERNAEREYRQHLQDVRQVLERDKRILEAEVRRYADLNARYIAEVGRLRADLAVWRRLAHEKVRTRRAVVERVAAGEPVADVAADYKVPAEWVAAISAPGYDFSSDPEAEIETLKAKIADYEADHRAICGGECAPDELHCSCVPHLRDEITRLAGVSERATLGTTVSGLPSAVAGAMSQPTPALSEDDFRAGYEAGIADEHVNVEFAWKVYSNQV